jgi:hypothetical protein
LKVAVTLLSAFMISSQASAPVQAPDHPTKAHPSAACAFTATNVPGAKELAQLVPQSIPAGCEVTVPLPSRVTVRVGPAKVAVALLASLVVTVHMPVPAHAPDHPAKEDPAAAVAVRVTIAPGWNQVVQVVPAVDPGWRGDDGPDAWAHLDDRQRLPGHELGGH